MDVNFHGILLWKRRDFVQNNKIRFQFIRWKFSQRKKRNLCFMLYLRFITTLLPCFVLWPYLYSQFIAEQLVTLLNVVHCALYHVCNNHIGGQSDIATKNFLKQNQTKSTMLIGFGGDLVDCFVLLFFFLFNSKFTEKCQIKFYIFDCFEI